MQSSQTGLCGKFVDLSQSGGWLFHNPNSFVQIFQNSRLVFLESKCFELLSLSDLVLLRIYNFCRWTIKTMKLWQTSSNFLFWQSKSKNWVQTCWPRKQLPGKLWTKLPAITNCLHTRVNLVFVGWSISHKLCGWNSEFLQSANKTSWQVWNLKL